MAKVPPSQAASEEWNLLRRELLEIGAIERRRVKLRDPSDHLKLLTTSITKLKSIEEIVRLESGSRGAELRCVILTDFIRKAEMPKFTGEVAVCEDIGIVPIFEYLRRAALTDIRLGVLSGSLVIIPSSAEPILRQAATGLGIEPRDPLDLSAKPRSRLFERRNTRRILSRLSSLDHIGFPAGRNNRAGGNEILAGGKAGTRHA